MPKELIYSTQKTGFEPDRAYANPRFFSAVRSGVERVFVVGSWPAVVAAYKAEGVQVVSVQDTAELCAVMAGGQPAKAVSKPVDPQAAALQAAGLKAPGAGQVGPEIPADWRDLPWPQLRSLASNFAEGVLNKPDAVAAIQAELNRRAAG